MNAARLERKIAGCAKRVASPARSKQSSPISSPARSSSVGQRALDARARARDRHPLPGEEHRGAALDTHRCIIAACGDAGTAPRGGQITPARGVSDPPCGGCWRRSVDQARGARRAGRRRRGCARRACGRGRSCARGSCAARGAARRRSRGWSRPRAIRSSTSRSRGESAGVAPSRLRLEDGHPEPDHPHRAGDVGGAPVLGDEARPPRPPSPRPARSRPAPLISSTFVVGERSRSCWQISGPGLLADEEVDERDVGLVARGELVGLGAGAGAQRALDPRLVAEHRAKAPVDDVVVVDDQDAQLGLGVGGVERPRRSRSWLLEGDDQAHLPASRSRGAELEQAAGLERLEAGEAQAHPGGPVGASLDAVVGDLEHERAVARSRCARRRASPARAWRRCGSPRRAPTGRAARAAAGTGDASRRRPRSRASGYSWRRRAISSRERRARRGGRAPERALHRRAQVAERLLDLLGAAPPRLLVEAAGRRRARARRRTGAGRRPRGPRARGRCAARARPRARAGASRRAPSPRAPPSCRGSTAPRARRRSAAARRRRGRRGSRRASARAPTSASRRRCGPAAARRSRPGAGSSRSSRSLDARGPARAPRARARPTRA